RTGYRFAGWATTENGEVDYSDGVSVINLTQENGGTVILYAQWIEENYTISFNSNGGSAVTDMTNVHYGDAISAPISPTRNGYVFSGWYKDSMLEMKYEFNEMPAESFTLYAKWVCIDYNISYELNGGTNHENNLGVYTIETQNISLGNPKRDYYTFDGWYTDKEFKNKISGTAVPKGSTGYKTFYAKWNAISYNITYGNLNGVEHNNQTNYTIESKITLNSPSNRLGYTFDGWYDNAEFSGTEVTTIELGNSSDKSFYAKWRVDSYEIKYDLNGGDNSGNPLSYNIESASITLTAPTRSGYNFDGWYTDSGFVNKVNGVAIDGGSTGVKTFYAKWLAISYNIQYLLDSGTNSNNNPISYTIETSTIILENPTRTGYTFLGWFDNSSGTSMQITNIMKGSMGNKTLQAKWKLEEYTITYNLNGGTNGANPTGYTVESQTIALSNPTKGTDDAFGGWYLNSSFTGEAITNITQGSTGNVTLFAKWNNFGRFNVVNNSNNTFTINRKSGTDGVQTVYYRTNNGSAIGGTHFTHANASVTFANGETTKTVIITEQLVTTQYNGNVATSYSNADRVYFFDIYKVDGGGKLDITTRATRTMVKDNNFTVDDMYSDYRVIASKLGQNMRIYESSGGGFAGTVSTGLSSNVLNNGAFNSYLQNYINNTASGMKIQLRNFAGKDDGWRMWRYVLFNNHINNVSFNSNKNSAIIPNVPDGTKHALVYGITVDKNNTDTYSVSLPGNTGAITASGTSYGVSINDFKRAPGQDTGDYVLYGLNETCGISVGAYNSASADSSWYFKGASLFAAPKDIKEPTNIGIAPMASQTYNKGDEVTVSLVFDEIVCLVDGVSIKTMLSDKEFTLVGGAGTNVLYFKGTVTNINSSAPTMNDVSIIGGENIKDLSN
ncbi:MAG: InlB B-repeat-containing protein, partial [Oscillospiraceae bacterium]